MIENWISLRHSPHKPHFHGCRPTKTHDLFDWVIWSPFDEGLTRTAITEPKTILCLSSPESVDLLVSLVRQMTCKPNVVFAGMDTALSSLKSKIEPVFSRLGKIFFEAKDIQSERVKSFSMGYISYYLRDSSLSNIAQAISYSDNVEKQNQVLAAWGRRWKCLDEKIDDRARANQFLEQCDFLSRRSIPFEHYWQELAKYKFLLSPRGQGVQSPKLAEAWMLKVVPIVTRTPCFEDLHELGYPIIILDDWVEITPKNIHYWETHYAQVDWARIRYMLSNDYLKELLVL